MIPFDAISWDTSHRDRRSSLQIEEPGNALYSFITRLKGYGALRLTALTLSSLLLTACTNSKLIISPLYNRLDDQMRSEFNKLGEFNQTQNDAFEQAVGTFHVWHRQVEMPKYADLLQEIAASIATSGATERDDVARWADTAERYSRHVRECHPVNYLFDMVQSLSDEQIDFIEKRFRSERKKNRERHASQTHEERIERRLKNIVKWLGRVGLDLTIAQRRIVREGLTQQVSLRDEYYELSNKWNRDLFTLARNQENPNYDEALAKHMSKLWTLLEDTHPQEWHSIRTLWRNTVYTLVGTFSKGQRAAISRWLNTMGQTVRAISKDTPSFKAGNDPAVGCQVL